MTTHTSTATIINRVGASDTRGGDALIDVRGLTVTYGRPGDSHAAVTDFDLRLIAGETVAIVGESGSGKSTTANAILGLLPDGGRVTAGSVRIGGTDYTGASEAKFRAVRGRVIGLVPQDPTVGLNPTLRIGAQVAEAVRSRGKVNRRSVDAETIEALEKAGLDNAVLRARQYPHELSGGMRQRVLIAIALAGNPRVIIADEPTSALDVTVQKTILDHLQRLVAETGIALVIITHDLGVASDRADRIIVMQHGRAVEQGSPHQILVAPSHQYTRNLIAAAPALSASGHVVPRFTDTPEAPDILALDGITKDFVLPKAPAAERTFRALDDVSLTVPTGQTLAVVGESGSGKTTALRIALGLEKPTAGRVVFDGDDVTGQGWRQLRPLRRRFQLVHQNPYSSLDPKFSVRDTIIEPLVSFAVGDRSSREARARELLDQVSLPASFLERRPAELSGGQRQRVAIARALALKPDLVFLDEPVSALDVSVQNQILLLLAELQRELGVSYFFISHDLAVVAQISHQVAVLHRGRVVEQGPTARVFSNPNSEYTRALLEAIPGQRRPTEPADAVSARRIPS